MYLFLNFNRATTTRRPASFLNAIFRAIATATSPQAPSTKSAVVESRRRRILSSLMKNAAASDQGELHNGPWERLALTQRTLGRRFFPRLSHDTRRGTKVAPVAREHARKRLGTRQPLVDCFAVLTFESPPKSLKSCSYIL